MIKLFKILFVAMALSLVFSLAPFGLSAPGVANASAVRASCTEILLNGESVGDGIYTIDPSQSSNPVDVYCDMTTDGGGWTLMGYGEDSRLDGKLTVDNGSYDGLLRTGSANIYSVDLVRGSTEVALSWDQTGTPTGTLTSYDWALSYPIPNPSAQSLDPAFHDGASCFDARWTLVDVTKHASVSGQNLPDQMYTRTSSLGASYGRSYGLVNPAHNTFCDWGIDTQHFMAVYLRIGSLGGFSPGAHTGVVYEGPDPNHSNPLTHHIQRGPHVIPKTMAIWARGELPDDGDGDGVFDPVDFCPDTPDGESVDDNGCSASQLDDDNDGVSDADDLCSGTVIPEAVPTTGKLNPNHWALVDNDGIFDTVSKGKGKGPGRSYTIEDTAGCSGTQIIEALGLGKGHTKFGVSIDAMDEWVALVSS